MRPYLTLHDPATARGYYEAGLWSDDTFYTLLARHAAQMPSAIALRDGENRLDWQSLKARVDALADDFAERGIGVGDCVSIWMSNRIEAVVTFLAGLDLLVPGALLAPLVFFGELVRTPREVFSALCLSPLLASPAAAANRCTHLKLRDKSSQDASYQHPIRALRSSLHIATQNSAFESPMLRLETMQSGKCLK